MLRDVVNKTLSNPIQYRERNILHSLISADFGRIASAQKIFDLNSLI